MDRHTTTASFGYLDWQDLYNQEKPYELYLDVPNSASDLKRSNLVFKEVKHPLHDVRGLESQLTLDDNGFFYRRHRTSLTDAMLRDRDAVEKFYAPEVEALLRSELGRVDEIFFFDWRLRKHRPENLQGPLDLNDKTAYLRPAKEMHVDQSPTAVLKRLRLQLPGRVDFLLKGRVRIVNVWRPLINAVEDWPLALCDGSTIRKSDLVECDNVRKHYAGSTMYLLQNDGQKWYYMSKQGKEDVLVFKTFDSDRNVKSVCTPHGSCKLSDVPPNLEPRASIEVRAMVFTYAA